MKKALLKKSDLFIIVFFFCLSFWLLRGALPLYFQQDEWHFFGWVMNAREKGLAFLLTNPFTSSVRPLSQLTFQAIYHFFGTNEVYYNAFSLFFHTLNTFLVFLVAEKLTKDKLTGLLAGLFFLLNPVHSQSYTWIGASIGTLLSAFFGLLAVVFFLYSLEKKDRKVRTWSLILVIISLGFKETTAFLLLFLPLLNFVFSGKKKRKTTLKSNLVFLISFLGLAVYRVSPLLEKTDTGTYLGAKNSGNFLMGLVYNTVTYPLEAISQTFVSGREIYFLANELTKTKFSFLHNNALVEQTLGSELVSVLLSFFILGFIFVSFNFLLKTKREKQPLLLSLSFLLLSTLPLIFLPKSTAFLESRNYYLVTPASAILFGLVSSGLFRALYQERQVGTREWRLSTMVFLTGVIGLYLFYFWQRIDNEIKIMTEIGNRRKAIVNQIISTYPELPDRAVFYSESDSFDYGPTGSVMPFQSGFGHVLLVAYSQTGEFNPSFFEEDYLWGIWDEGYKEIGSQGFGYFRRREELLKTVKEEGLSKENVFAFEWKESRLKDITPAVRKTI